MVRSLLLPLFLSSSSSSSCLSSVRLSVCAIFALQTSTKMRPKPIGMCVKWCIERVNEFIHNVRYVWILIYNWNILCIDHVRVSFATENKCTATKTFVFYAKERVPQSKMRRMSYQFFYSSCCCAPIRRKCAFMCLWVYCCFEWPECVRLCWFFINYRETIHSLARGAHMPLSFFASSLVLAYTHTHTNWTLFPSDFRIFSVWVWRKS